MADFLRWIGGCLVSIALCFAILYMLAYGMGAV